MTSDAPPPHPDRQVTFAGTFDPTVDGDDWTKVTDGLDEPAPARERRPVRRTAVVVLAVLAAVVTTLATVPVATTLADHLRSAPAPLVVAAPEPVDPTRAEALYAAANPSVVTLLTADGTSGSGFIYQRGVVLTNWHVVASTPAAAASIALDREVQVQVIAADGRERVGTVRAVDDRLDLALVDVEGLDDLAPLALGDPDDLSIGADVFVLGSPFGIPNTMTTGVVTGLHINTAFASTPVQSGLLMTDAASNPGNSGGPLLDATGRVLGVITLRPDESGGRSVQGLTFALPADAVAWSAGWLERGEKPPYVLLGVGARTAPPDMGGPGVLVVAVTPDMGAAEAGLAPGDVIVAANGQQLTAFVDLVRVLRTVGVGEVVRLTVERTDAEDPDGEIEVLDIDVEVSERPDGM